MANRKLQPALQYSEGRSRPWSGAKLINAFSEMADGDKADQFAVMGIPGLVEFANLPTFPVRGEHRMGDTLYVVSGTRLYSVSEAGSHTDLGEVGGSLPVMMADNGEQLAIQGGALHNQGYVLDSGTLYTGITNLPAVSNVVYIGGFFVWTIFDSDQFIISALNDGLSYDPLDVATVEGDPDDVIGVVNDHLQLHFGGQRSFEIWYQSGAADFPFERLGTAFIERGLLDRDSLVKIDNSVHFVGDDRIVYRMNDLAPTRISTHSIEHQIADATWFRCFPYTQLGHKFYMLNTDVGTFGYDMATGAWHERKSLGRDNYRCWYATRVYGGEIFGDGYTGKLYRPDLDVNTEDGEVIPVTIELPSLQTDRMKSTLYSIEAQIQAGVGNSDDPDPQITLQYSKDGGNTWSAELARPMGKVGEYLTRCIWRLGVSFRQLQFRFRLSGKVQRFVISYYADVR